MPRQRYEVGQWTALVITSTVKSKAGIGSDIQEETRSTVAIWDGYAELEDANYIEMTVDGFVELLSMMHMIKNDLVIPDPKEASDDGGN